MTDRKNILVLGVSGMLGSVVYQHFTYYSIGNTYGTSRQKIKKYPNLIQFSTSNLEQIDKIIEETKPDYIINCIGTIPQVNPSKSEYYRNNFDLPARIVEKHKGVVLIQPSTDCVFSGERIEDRKFNFYTNEYDFANEQYLAKDSYGLSKQVFDKIYGNKAIVLRGSIIGPGIVSKGSGLFDWVASKRGTTVNGYTNHYWNGNTTLEFAKLAAKFVTESNKEFGIYTLGNKEVLTKYELVKKISDVFRLKIDVKEFETEKAVDKTLQTSDLVLPFSKQIEELNFWCREHKILI